MHPREAPARSRLRARRRRGDDVGRWTARSRASCSTTTSRQPTERAAGGHLVRRAGDRGGDRRPCAVEGTGPRCTTRRSARRRRSAACWRSAPWSGAVAPRRHRTGVQPHHARCDARARRAGRHARRPDCCRMREHRPRPSQGQRRSGAQGDALPAQRRAPRPGPRPRSASRSGCPRASAAPPTRPTSAPAA